MNTNRNLLLFDISSRVGCFKIVIFYILIYLSCLLVMAMFVVTGHNQPKTGHWWKQSNAQAFFSDLVVQHFLLHVPLGNFYRDDRSLLPNMVSFSLNRSMFCTHGRADIAQLMFSWAGQWFLTWQKWKFRCFPLWQHKMSFSDQPIWAFIFPKWRIMSSVWFQSICHSDPLGHQRLPGETRIILENYISRKLHAMGPLMDQQGVSGRLPAVGLL